MATRRGPFARRSWRATESGSGRTFDPEVTGSPIMKLGFVRANLPGQKASGMAGTVSGPARAGNDEGWETEPRAWVGFQSDSAAQQALEEGALRAARPRWLQTT